MGISVVAEALSSKRFKKIKSMFHLVNNQSLTAADSKMTMLPLYSVSSLLCGTSFAASFNRDK